MAKILLVEDDNNLREIYEARLQAEGYTIVSARDGEEALVVAKAEMPDLVISDVMMPKISGFEMLDILRDTETLRDVKVIMLTALGQAEDQTRADKLGADRYLVKSQVTLEDIVNVASELLGNAPEAAPAAAPVPETVAATPVAAAPDPTPAPATEPVVAPVEPVAAAQPVAAPASAPEPVTAPLPEPAAPVAVAPEPASAPAPEPAAAPEPAVVAPPAVPSQPTEADAAADVQAQINSFAAAPAVDPPAVDPAKAAQDQAMQDAITELGGAEEKTAAPVEAEQAAPVAEAQASPAPEAPAAEPTPPTTPTEAKSEYVAGVSGKKVISPISHEDEDKKSLDQLLAEEDAKESGLGIPTASGSAPAPEIPVESTMPPVDPAILANTDANPQKDEEAEAAAILAGAKAAADPTAGAPAPEIKKDAPQTPAGGTQPADTIDPSSIAL